MTKLRKTEIPADFRAMTDYELQEVFDACVHGRRPYSDRFTAETERKRREELHNLRHNIADFWPKQIAEHERHIANYRAEIARAEKRIAKLEAPPA